MEMTEFSLLGEHSL